VAGAIQLTEEVKMQLSLDEKKLNKLLFELEKANTKMLNTFPGESESRQPVHTVYGGAHLFKPGTAKKIGEIGAASFSKFCPDAKTLTDIFDIEPQLASKVYDRVLSKMQSEAVEDFRIDFEDGFGHRSDAEEDEWAMTAAKNVAAAMSEKSLPPFIGIRIKPLSEELKRRSLRTLDIFLTTLLQESKSQLPDNFVVTLPKITHVDQVSALVQVFEWLEKQNSLEKGTLKMEFMVETPQSLIDHKGRAALPKFVKAAKGRVVAAHFGTYDYTASVNITADYQSMDHPSCDFARSIMKVTLSGTGLFLSDGATNVMPVGDDKENIYRVWKLNYAHLQHSLMNGYYQGWDLHPAQIPIRYVALYTFFLQGFESARDRLKNFIEQASKATLVGDIFDDAATGQGLLNYFLRAHNCGAITEEEFLSTGLTPDEVRLRSFAKILKGRKQQ
jgi:citrate lyase beta subunit